jgi:hypothetical protein
MMMAAYVSTNPAHGVIAASPATAPVTAPSTVACPSVKRSLSSQASIAAAAATWVLITACAATLSARRPSAPLKPNQPNQSSPAPSTTSGIE